MSKQSYLVPEYLDVSSWTLVDAYRQQPEPGVFSGHIDYFPEQIAKDLVEAGYLTDLKVDENCSGLTYEAKITEKGRQLVLTWRMRRARTNTDDFESLSSELLTKYAYSLLSAEVGRSIFISGFDDALYLCTSEAWALLGFLKPNPNKPLTEHKFYDKTLFDLTPKGWSLIRYAAQKYPLELLLESKAFEAMIPILVNLVAKEYWSIWLSRLSGENAHLLARKLDEIS